jgi:hypothetical protein
MSADIQVQNWPVPERVKKIFDERLKTIVERLSAGGEPSENRNI